MLVPTTLPHTQKKHDADGNDLAHVPKEKLLVISAHIPFVTYTDATAQKHQVDNLDEMYAIVGDRPALGLSGHTHTTEQIVPGEHFHGWQENTGTGPARFHQIVTGAVSGSWWAGDLDDAGIPHATGRLGSPRGYYVLDFDGAGYVDTYVRFGGRADEQFHASFNTPRFRRWAATEPCRARPATLPRYPAGSAASASRRALCAFISFHACGRLCGASQCSRVASWNFFRR